MQNKAIKVVLPLVLILLFAGGCSKTIVDAPDPGSSSALSSGTDIDYPPAEYSEEGLPKEGTLDDAVGTNNASMTGLTDKGNMGRTSPGMQPIYFHFDQATIPQDMTNILIQNATFLKDNPSLYVIVEGNCDERGAKEYNMALGERRALNTQKFLADMGIHSNRIRTISYGEEKPVDTESNEAAWTKNRRVDFMTE